MAYLASLCWLALSVMAALQNKDELSNFSIATSMFFLGVAMIISAINRRKT